MAASGPRLRADAQRNIEAIRTAALDVFRVHGLNCPLEEVARAAGVSKGTIYHRFGNRQGLIDVVVEELVAERLNSIISAATALDEPVDRLESYLRGVWLLQFDEPAVNDVLLSVLPGSVPVAVLCERASAVAARFLRDAQKSGLTRKDLTPRDLDLLTWERGIIAQACKQQPREGYRRRLEYTLRGLRA